MDGAEIKSPKRWEFSIYQTRAQCDQRFALMLWAHFGVSLLLAFWYRTFEEAFLVGLTTSAVAAYFARTQPGSLLTRLVIGAAFMVYSGLFIHQCRGVTELHFHVFASLATLGVYRDWRVIVVAAAVIAVHHATFALLQWLGLPVYVYTTNLNYIILTLIHALFVVLESAILVWQAIQGEAEWRQAEELSRLGQELSSERFAGNDLTAQIAWDEQSPLWGTVSVINQLMARLNRNIAETKQAAHAIVAQTESVHQETRQINQRASRLPRRASTARANWSSTTAAQLKTPRNTTPNAPPKASTSSSKSPNRWTRCSRPCAPASKPPPTRPTKWR